MTEPNETKPLELNLASELPLPSDVSWRFAQANLQPVDVADQLTALLTAEEIAACLDLLPLLRRTEIFDYLPEGIQEEVAAVFSLDSLMELLEELPSDSAADLFNLLTPDQQADLLRDLPARNRATLEHLSRYPVDRKSVV